MEPSTPATDENGVRIERFADPADLLANLRLSHERWIPTGSWTTPWVFRGQGCGCWSPVPSSWRPQQQGTHLYREAAEKIEEFEVEMEALNWRHLPLGDEVLRQRIRMHLIQRRFEYLAVLSFADVANRLGMRVPFSPQEEEGVRTEVDDDPPVTRIEALAQHHGMPTRLLDWTENPLYAAFFAASTCDKCSVHGPRGKVSVWALDLSEDELSCDWRAFRVPRHENEFLNAQSGLFLYHQSPSAKLVQDGAWPSLVRDRRQKLIRLMLPKAKCRELLRLLWVEGVSLARLMPTLDNVKSALELMWEAIARERNKQQLPSYDGSSSSSSSSSGDEDNYSY